MKKAWQKTRVDRMLVDHILRAGHYSAAMSLAESSGIEVRGERMRMRESSGGRKEKEGEIYHQCWLSFHRNLLMWTSLLFAREWRMH